MNAWGRVILIELKNWEENILALNSSLWLIFLVNDLTQANILIIYKIGHNSKELIRGIKQGMGNQKMKEAMSRIQDRAFDANELVDFEAMLWREKSRDALSGFD